ncbi:MAG: DUF4369 domain-containing protein [Bacteroidales bacterium]|nr:DUF4369 domain-containing protein [Bacteroidales bacterium]
MRKIFLSLLALVSLASCNENKTYIIEGALYGGGKFEGETIYLVPFENPENRIDSAFIHEGRFRFDGKVENAEICKIRMRPMMRLFIQELFIVKEPGHVRTILSKRSYTQGTPQNDSLQAWIDYKAATDSVIIAINKQKKRASDDELKALSQKQDSIQIVFDKHNRGVVERNNNAFGDFVNKYATISASK